MVTRRVVTCARQAPAAGQVLPTPSLLLAEEALPAPGPDEVLVRIVASVVDPEPLLAGAPAGIPEAAFVGTIENGSAQAGLPRGTLVAGVAPLADVAALPAGRLQPLPSDTGLSRESLALIPLLSSLVAALGDTGLTLGDRVLVAGRGLTARLAAQLAEVRTGKPPHVFTRTHGSGDEDAFRSLQKKASEFDVLIDTTADSAWWPRVLGLVGRMGRVLLLLPPGPQVHPFDFYQRVHRGSYSMLARRVPSPYRQPGTSEHDGRMIRHLLDHGLVKVDDLLSAVHVGARPSDGTAIDLRTVGEGKGLVYWFDERG